MKIRMLTITIVARRICRVRFSLRWSLTSSVTLFRTNRWQGPITQWYASHVIVRYRWSPKHFNMHYFISIENGKIFKCILMFWCRHWQRACCMYGEHAIRMASMLYVLLARINQVQIQIIDCNLRIIEKSIYPNLNAFI